MKAPAPRHGRLYFAVEYLGSRSLYAIASALPRGVRRRFLRVLAAAWFHAFPRHRRVALESLEAAYGATLPPAELRRIARASFDHMARVVSGWLDLSSGRASGVPPPSFRVEDPGRVVDRILGGGRGAIWVSAHLGHWESLGAFAAARGLPLVSIHRPPNNPHLARWLERLRARADFRLVAKWNAARGVVRLLREGGHLGLLADQDAGRRGVLVPFFGRLASTSAAPATYAVLAGVPIVVGFGLFEGEGERVLVRFDRLLEPRPGASHREEVRRLTEEVARAVESAIRSAPEQYVWLHRRFKTTPVSVRTWYERHGRRVATGT